MSKEYMEVNNKDGKSVVVSQDIGIQDWKLIGVFSLDNITSLAPYYSTVIVIIMCLNVAFVFICSMLLTYLIFKPLAKVEKHMKIVENGEFVTMPVEDNANEITSLKKYLTI